MPRPLLLLALSLTCLAPSAAVAAEARLTILHTTDLHGALTGWDYVTDRPAGRGLTRVATLVRRVRAEGGPVLLLDGGDCMQGSPLEAVWHQGGGRGPDPMMTAMTRLGYDAMAVGNHEFDYGPDGIARARADATFPWLAANVLRESDGKPAFEPSLVKQFGNLKVGVVGICTPAVPSLVDSASRAGLRFVPAVQAARNEVARLRDAERCDVVVLLAHTGLSFDPASGRERVGDAPGENIGRDLARDVPGVDVVILGHTHIVVPSLEIGGTLVTQAGSRGEQLGRIDLRFARAGDRERWKLEERRGSMIAVSDSVPADSGLAAFSEPYHQAAEAAMAETIGVALAPITAPRGRLEDNAIWELIHRAQLDASGADVSLASLPDPDVRLPRGPLTMRTMMGLYPYDNTLAVVELTGAELDSVLEQAARYFSPAPYDFTDGCPLVDPAAQGYQFDSAEGVTYEIDLTQPPGRRIVHLAFHGQPLASDQHLKVAVNSYRLNGGGGFEIIRRAPRLWRSPLAVRDLIAGQVRKLRVLDGSFSRNWTVLPDYAPAPERPFVDLMVREHAVPAAEVMRLSPAELARRGDLAYWLARAFGWRETRLSGAFADVPDSLEPWLDGLVRRRALGPSTSGERFDPFATVPLSLALDWCEGVARKADYPLTSLLGDPSFRRGLLTGIPFGRSVRPPGAFVYPDSLTRGQTLALVANLRYPSIRVLETTDFHGAILPGRDRRTNRPLGGSVALAQWIARLRSENPEGTVLVDGGDLFQGTMISNLAFGRPVVEQMNSLGYAATAIGNHEFDWTADTLERRVHEMKFAALGANMTLAKTGKRPRWVRADTTVTRRGVRIGVLGLCYPQTPSVTLARNVAHLRFGDDSTAAAALVPQLRRREGADVVVVVGHIPANTDSSGHAHGDLPRLAAAGGADVWFGGHSHNRVLDQVNGVPIMIAGSHGEVIAVCDLRVDPVRHRVIDRRARLELVYGDSLAPDTAMAARVTRWNAGVTQIAAAALGHNASRLTRNRGGESTVGDLVCDAMRAAVGADIAFQNSGGLRADLPEGVVTRGAIYEVMPFDNTIVTMKLTGAEVKRALEDGLKGGRASQVSGLRYTFDLDRPEMDRVTALLDSAGAPLDTARTFRVAVNNFMASGGDDYFTLTRGRESTDTQLLVRDALESWVRQRCAAGAALDVRPDGRITRRGRGPSGD
jgi:2',3'-cyclic-nucleotide 2'-phosphodiesterase/3'-nucleotidase